MDVTNAQALKGYELKKQIGTGGFGEVYQAYQTSVGREVAIKFILPTLANTPDFIRRFESEAQLIARLEHPHITPLYDYWRDPNGAYLVMRWLRGGSLRDTLQNGPLELRAAALLLDQIAGALSLAHRNGVIHRDIKPGNILLDEDGNAYLTDFGIAKDLNLPTNNTLQDAIVGSLDYISPEQARSEPVTPRTDIYSLGVTMYEVVTGHHPFEGISSVERLYKHINDPLPQITSLDPEVVDEMNIVIQKATAKNPAERYADALAFAADFREAAGLDRIPSSLIESLTQREHEILNLIVQGRSNKEIAQDLMIALTTVKWYARQIYSKLGVRSRVQAIVRARELKLIIPDGGTEIIGASDIPTEDFHPENPYKGLRAFASADALDFFGRERIVTKLVNRLSETNEYGRFLAVVGPSGSGKSSLVKAGLIPALWRGELPRSEKWFIIEMLPGNQPLDELEIALTRVAANNAGGIREQLERDIRGLSRVAGLILPNDDSELLLVIDQFEEVFTLVEDEKRQAYFLDLIYYAVTAPRSRVRVVITLRADFYDRPLHYPQFGELVRTRLETIMPLSAEELESAISRPAERMGVTFEPGLVSSIVADVSYQPGALPLLQYALTELFEQRKGHVVLREIYESIGKTTGALAKRAEELYLSMDDAGKETVRQLFLRLVTLGEGTEDTRRRVTHSELISVMADGDLMDDIIDTYTGYRLLTLDTEPGTRAPTVEVAHEAILREWERLKVWLTESRDEIRLQRQLALMAGEWRDAKRDTSFLALGSRLETFEKWTAETKLALTPHEREFVEASLKHRDEAQRAESARQAHEAALERRSFLFLRTLVVVLAIAAGGALGLSIFAFDREQQAQSARVRAEREASVNHSLVLANAAEDRFEGGQTELALRLALEAVALENPPIEAETALRAVASGIGSRAVFREHLYTVESVAFSPDEQFAVSTSCNQMQNSKCVLGEMILYDLQAENALHRFVGHKAVITDALFTPDGEQIWSASSDGSIILWSANPESASFGSVLNSHDFDHGIIYDIALSGDILLAATDEGIISFDVTTGTATDFFEAHESPVTTLTVSSDGQNVLSGSENALILLWKRDTGEIIQRFEGHSTPISKVAFHPTLPQVVSASEDATLRVWDINTGLELNRYQTPTFINDFSVSADGDTVIVDGGGGAIQILELNTFTISTYLLNNPDGDVTGNEQSAHSITYDKQGLSFLTGHDDGSVVLWNLAIRHDAHHFDLDTVPAGFMSMGISPDGKRMLTGMFEGGEAVLWDIDLSSPTYGEALAHFGNYQGPVFLLNFSPDGRYALVGEADYYGDTGAKSLILWNVDENSDQFGQQMHILEGFDLLPRSSAFTPDGRSILAGTSVLQGYSGELLMWDVATGNLVQKFEGNQYSVASILITPDSKRALIAHNNTNLMIEWDIDTESPNFGTAIRQIETLGYVFDMAWSPDGDSLLVAETGSELVERDYATGAVHRRLNGLGLAIWSVKVTGNYVIGGNEQTRVGLWDYESGTLLWLSPPQESIVNFLGVSPDSLYAYSLAFGGNPVQWQISEPSLDELLNWITNNRYVRDFTCEERVQYRIEPLCET